MDKQNATPEEEVGGYGTPTAEQEAGGGQAQPRVEEDIEEAVLGEGTGAPNLSHLDPEDSDSSGEPGAGRFGGTDEQHLAEQSTQPDGNDKDLPDGSGNDLPQEESPNDDDEESFDAG